MHPDNASALPEGLTGLYASALPASQHVGGRNRFMEFFTPWVLVQKEVSAAMVADILTEWLGHVQWTEQTVLEEIASWSKWFNVPTAGTFQIYHERLRAYILQRNSEHQMEACNRAIIACCRRALQRRAADEWERYALQHLQRHLLIPAMQTGDAAELKRLCYDTMHWNRQIEISKGFDWSRRMLDEMMLWASKYDDDEVIECALNKVDLHHLEQNDAPRIVELVAQNDVETALKRIEAFAGNDKEGLQRKFILYMLCLMELTLLESKDKPFRREACEALLKHLDDNLPVDHSILSWDDFFPSYLVFLMASEWAELGLDYLIVYKRTSDWASDWISEQGPYSDVQFEVLLNLSSFTSLNKNKGWLQYVISIELNKQKKTDESLTLLKIALETTNRIIEEWDKNSSLENISRDLARHHRIEKVVEILKFIINEIDKERIYFIHKVIIEELLALGKLKDALDIAHSITDNDIRNSVLSVIPYKLSSQGRLVEALVTAREITSDEDKSSALRRISEELAGQGKVEESELVIQEALETARKIPDGEDKSSALLVISAELRKQEKLDESTLVLQEALETVREIPDDWKRSSALSDISVELARQGKVEKALETAFKITHDKYKSSALMDISRELARQGNFEQAIKTTRRITDNILKSSVLLAISAELHKQGIFDVSSIVIQEAIEIAHKISYELDKGYALLSISTELYNQGKLEASTSIMKFAIKCFLSIDDETYLNQEIRKISKELVRQGRLNEALETTNYLTYDKAKNDALACISGEFTMQGMFKEAFDIASLITNEDYKNQELFEISVELAAKGRPQDSLKMVVGITYNNTKNDALGEISGILIKNSELEEGIKIARLITDETKRNTVYEQISKEFVVLGRLNEALEIANGITDSHKTYALMNISRELAKQGNVEEAIEIVHSITDDTFNKNYLLSAISNELTKQGRLIDALETSRKITDTTWKSSKLSVISAELSKQAKLKEAFFVFVETLQINHTITNNLCNSILLEISKELVKLGSCDDALQIALSINDDNEKNSALRIISVGLTREGRFEKALEYSRFITINRRKISAQCEISNELYKQSKLEESSIVLQEALITAHETPNEIVKSSALREISTELYEQAKPKESSFVLQEALETAQRISDYEARYSAELDISYELYRQRKIDESKLVIKEALKTARSITNDQARCSAELKISNAMLKMNMSECSEEIIQDVLQFYRFIEDDIDLYISEYDKNSIFKEISWSLACQGRIKDAIETIRGITDDNDKRDVMETVSTELVRQGKFEDAIKTAHDMNLIFADYENYVLSDISCELSKQGNWPHAEEVGLEIPRAATRHECWKKMASTLIEQAGWQIAFSKVNELTTDEAHSFYLKGWAENAKVTDVDKSCLRQAIPYFPNDVKSLEHLLHHYAIHEIFLGDSSQEKIQRLNQTLSLQWALDIKKSLSNNQF
jgi:tetratricopeptide (TPR) repeat protein